MKRELIQNVMVVPFESGNAIDRSGFLSAVIGTIAAPGSEVKVALEHSDDGESFEPVTDELVFPESRTKGGIYTFTVPGIKAEDDEGDEGDKGDEDEGEGGEGGKEAPGDDAESASTLEPDALVNIDVDLLGLKNIVKFTVTGGDGLAIVLGDPSQGPV